MRRDSKNLKGF